MNPSELMNEILGLVTVILALYVITVCLFAF